MAEIGRKISVNGFVKLSKLLADNGFANGGRLHFLTLANPSTTVTLYAHRGSAAQPADPLVGIPILNNAYTWNSIAPATTWLYTASAIDIIVDAND